MNENNNAEKTKHTAFPSSLSLIFLCFIAGFGGAWIYSTTGLIESSTPQTITKNQEKIVTAEGEIMASIAKKVGPSVVSVTTESISDIGVRRIVSEGAGTGIIISRNGYIMTNKHVIKDAQNISIVTSSGTVYQDVEAVGSDPLNDIAFLKVNSGEDNFAPAHLGDSSQVEIGQKVISIGNALGQYQNSVTSGIISGIGRPILAQTGEGDEQLDSLLQTDAAINPGNSGGPLLNFNGEVIGINTAIAEDAEGIGFAIPVNASKGMAKSVLTNGTVKRAYLGVRYLNLTPRAAEELKISQTQGAYIYNDGTGSAIVSGSPADKAGLLNKDIITKVNDKTISESNSLALLLATYAPGDKVILTVLSGGNTKTVEVTLGEYRQ